MKRHKEEYLRKLKKNVGQVMYLKTLEKVLSLSLSLLSLSLPPQQYL